MLVPRFLKPEDTLHSGGKRYLAGDWGTRGEGCDEWGEGENSADRENMMAECRVLDVMTSTQIPNNWRSLL